MKNWKIVIKSCVGKDYRLRCEIVEADTEEQAKKSVKLKFFEQIQNCYETSERNPGSIQP